MNLQLPIPTRLVTRGTAEGGPCLPGVAEGGLCLALPEKGHLQHNYSEGC